MRIADIRWARRSGLSIGWGEVAFILVAYMLGGTILDILRSDYVMDT
jgi:hypothetical protein